MRPVEPFPSGTDLPGTEPPATSIETAMDSVAVSAQPLETHRSSNLPPQNQAAPGQNQAPPRVVKLRPTGGQVLATLQSSGCQRKSTGLTGEQMRGKRQSSTIKLRSSTVKSRSSLSRGPSSTGKPGVNGIWGVNKWKSSAAQVKIKGWSSGNQGRVKWKSSTLYPKKCYK